MLRISAGNEDPSEVVSDTGSADADDENFEELMLGTIHRTPRFQFGENAESVSRKRQIGI